MIKKRRTLVRIVSFLTAIVVALGVWGGMNMYKLAVIKRDVQASRERALTQLGTYMDDIDINLQKCLYSSSSAMLSDVASKLWRSSASAKESLSEITDGNTEISGVYKFLSQVGEYTLSLNEKIASGKKLTEKETENLKKLKDYSEKLSQTINYLIEEEENGGLDFEEVKSTLQSEGEEKLYLATELNDANQALEDYPTLIYDGPFSDHINTKKSALVEKLEEISQDKAQEKAAKFLGVRTEDIYFLNKTESNLSTYTFYNNNVTISVTQKGGLISYMLKSRYAGESKIATEDAIRKATAFLGEKGYTKVKESYYSTVDGVCTINYSYYEDGITYYTDLIKVSVALDDGEILGFDATGYIMNHKVRKVPENTKYDLRSAGKLLKDDLKILSNKKAFIPTDYETEDYVYEYRCEAEDSQEILVYIDPVTGEEKDILILLYTDGGVLTK
ncbi:MAG: hypothetical protein E7529_04345 [Ruminococcaceae bacterium]|nr:hypothetical protein [Oscillospiraceae bacterium]